MKYKLIVSDIDGVWTNGSFYYSEEGDVLRKFSTKDSYGVSLSRLAGIPILIISSEKNEMVQKRMEKLKLNNVELGVRNKLKSIVHFCNKNNLKLSETAFLGDDMNDYHLIGKVGYFACPADAYHSIRANADLVLKAKGGQGVFREFVETLLQQELLLDKVYKMYQEECLQEQE